MADEYRCYETGKLCPGPINTAQHIKANSCAVCPEREEVMRMEASNAATLRELAELDRNAGPTGIVGRNVRARRVEIGVGAASVVGAAGVEVAKAAGAIVAAGVKAIFK